MSNEDLKWHEHYYKDGVWNKKNIIIASVLIFLCIGIMSYMSVLENDSKKAKEVGKQLGITKGETTRPASQIDFESSNKKLSRLYKQAKNPIKKQKSLMNVFDYRIQFPNDNGWEIKNWYGKLDFMLMNNGDISVTITSNKYLKIEYSPLFIEQGEKLYDIIAEIDNGSNVYFSGHFKANIDDQKEQHRKKEFDMKEFSKSVKQANDALDGKYLPRNAEFGISESSFLESSKVSKPTFSVEIKDIRVAD